MRGRWPEILIVSIGVLLRLSMWATYDVGWGYDASSHQPYIDWFAHHTLSLPSLALCREAYHPPLYYVVAGKLHALGVGWQGLAGVSVLAGLIKLGVIWWACETLLPSRLARLVALSLAALMPSAMQLEGMVTNEGLSNLLAVLAMVLMLRLGTERRLRLAMGLGLLLGLEILTKVSGLALVGAVGLATLWELGTRGLRRLLPLVAGLAVLAATVTPYVAHNLREYGRPFLSGYDGKDAPQARLALQTPYLSRRPALYFVGWTSRIYATPYYPSGIERFFPALLASTFADAYNANFSSPPRPGRPAVLANYAPLRSAALAFARASVVGGTLIAAMTLAAWLVIFTGAVRRREVGLVAVLLCPLLALLGQLHFATAYPIDAEGPVKGLYMQFAAPPLCLLFGAGVAWCWRRGWPGKLAALSSLLALGMVASYTLYARLITPFTVY